MRILSGTASGIVLDVPKGLEVRPTGVRARGALFDSLSSISGWNNAVVVDLFAGSGALGLEAASRGAETVRFIEKSSKNVSSIDKNIAKLRKAGVQSDMEVLRGNAVASYKILHYLSGTIDYIFADPPYSEFEPLWNALLSDADFAEWAGDAIMIWETPPTATLAPPKKWRVVKRETRGGTIFTFLAPV